MAKILIVEDDIDLNQAYKMILEHENHTIESVFNGNEALEKVDAFEPDLILLDLLMPLKNGVEFLEEYNLEQLTKPAKVVVFTNLENSDEVNEAFRLGAYKCIVKSWTAPQGLAQVVNDILKSRH